MKAWIKTIWKVILWAKSGVTLNWREINELHFDIKHNTALNQSLYLETILDKKVCRNRWLEGKYWKSLNDSTYYMIDRCFKSYGIPFWVLDEFYKYSSKDETSDAAFNDLQSMLSAHE